MSLPLGPGSTLVSDVSAQDTPGNGLGDANVFSWLLDDISTYNANIPGTLPAPTTGLTTWENSGPVINVEAGDYLVLHYGKGNGGTGDGGGLVALYFDAAGTYDIPDLGSGPNGNGGISFARLWDHTGTQVPDSGSTALLVGLAFVGIEGARRKFAKT